MRYQDLYQRIPRVRDNFRREQLSTINAQTGSAARHIVSGYVELSVPIVGRSNAMRGLKSV